MPDPKRVELAVNVLAALESEEAIIAVATKAIVANNPELAPVAPLIQAGIKAAIDGVLSPAATGLVARVRRLFGF